MFLFLYKPVSAPCSGSYMIKTSMIQGLAYAYDMLKFSSFSKMSQGLGNDCIACYMLKKSEPIKTYKKTFSVRNILPSKLTTKEEKWNS